MRLIPRFAFIVLASVAMGPLAARADDPPTQEELDHVHWKFSAFMDGDSLKIRDLTNGTLEQQLNRKLEKTRRIDDDKAAIAARQDAAQAKLRASSPVFARMQDDLVTAKAQVAAARKAGDSVAIIKAQNTADALQDQIAKQVDQAISKDPDVISKQKEIKDTQAELRALEPAIASATKARDQLLDGMRLTLKIPGPPAVGKKGILGRVKPTKIVDAHSFTTDFDAFEVTGEDAKATKTPDGFKAYAGKPHLIHLLVTGVDTDKMHVGTETILDHTFAITATQPSGKATVYVVEPKATELREVAFDHLFDMLDELRVGTN